MDFDITILNQYIPPELLICIWEFFPIEIKMWTNKKYYLQYHHTLVIPRYEGFIRMIIRNNYSFLYKIHMKEQYSKWLGMKRFFYDGILFRNYLDFQVEYARRNKAKQIENIIIENRDECYNKKQNKTNRFKYCKWTN